MGGEWRCYMVVVGLSVLVVSWWLDGVAAWTEDVQIKFRNGFEEPSTVVVFHLAPGHLFHVPSTLPNKFETERPEWQDLRLIRVEGREDSQTNVWPLHYNETYYVIFKPHRQAIVGGEQQAMVGGELFPNHTRDTTKKWLCKGSRDGITTTSPGYRELKKEVQINFKNGFEVATNISVFHLPSGLGVRYMDSIFRTRVGWKDLRSIEGVPGGGVETQFWQLHVGQTYYIVYEPLDPQQPKVVGKLFTGKISDRTQNWMCTGNPNGVITTNLGNRDLRKEVEIKFKNDFLVPTNISVFHLLGHLALDETNVVFHIRDKWQDLHSIEDVPGDGSKTEVLPLYVDETYYIVYEPLHHQRPSVVDKLLPEARDRTQRLVCTGGPNGIATRSL